MRCKLHIPVVKGQADHKPAIEVNENDFIPFNGFLSIEFIAFMVKVNLLLI